MEITHEIPTSHGSSGQAKRAVLAEQVESQVSCQEQWWIHTVPQWVRSLGLLGHPEKYGWVDDKTPMRWAMRWAPNMTPVDPPWFVGVFLQVQFCCTSWV